MDLPREIVSKIASYVPESSAKEEAFDEQTLLEASKEHRQRIRDRVSELECVHDILKILNDHINAPTDGRSTTDTYLKWLSLHTIRQLFDGTYMVQSDDFTLPAMFPVIKGYMEEHAAARVECRLTYPMDDGGALGHRCTLSVRWLRAKLILNIEEAIYPDHQKGMLISLRKFFWIMLDGPCRIFSELSFIPDENDRIDSAFVVSVEPEINLGEEKIKPYEDAIISFLEVILSIQKGAEWDVSGPSKTLRTMIERNMNRLWMHGVNYS